MKTRSLVCFLVGAVAFVHLSAAHVGTQRIPTRFLPELTASAAIELAPAMHPSGEEFCFTRMMPGSPSVLLLMQAHDGEWSAPKAFVHASVADDAAACYSPDGSRLYFLSKRPTSTGEDARAEFHLWFCERKGDTWAEPRELQFPLGSPSGEGRPTFSADGMMYYVAEYPELGGEGIYCCQLTDGVPGMPRRLPDEINACGKVAVEPCITADGNCLIFYSAGREDNQSQRMLKGDLYYSHRQSGAWTPALPLPFPINTSNEESMPAISADGSRLLFASDRTPGQSFPDLYQVQLPPEVMSRK